MDKLDDLERAPMLTHDNHPTSFAGEIPEDAPQRISKTSEKTRYLLSRKYWLITSLIGLFIVLIVTLWATDRTRPWRRQNVYWNPGNGSATDDHSVVKILKTEAYLTGNLTRRFRDSLLPDTKYITAFLIAGWTNDVMAAVHIVQLAKLTNRVPILPPFPPSHTGPKSGLLLFSEVFDLPRFSKDLNIPIIEWHEIKNTTNPHPDPLAVQLYGDRWNDYYGGGSEELGCWSLWMTQRAKGAPAREGRLPEAFNLDISWTPVPWGYQVPTQDGLDYNTNEAASLATPSGRKLGIEASKQYLSLLDKQMKNLTNSEKFGVGPKEIPTKNRVGHQVDPEDQLVCYDYLYFMATYTEFEWWQEWTPAWESAGKYLHWSPHVRSLAISLLNSALNITDSPPTSLSALSARSSSSTPSLVATPPSTLSSTPSSVATLPTYVAVHIRRTDFDGWCGNVTRDECLAPLSGYERRVKEVLSELRANQPPNSNLPINIPILVMSDEPKTTPSDRELGTSEAWWDSVSKLGWIHIDHEVHKTADRFGTWYPAILDATMLSLSSAFVGTDRSTYSLLAKKRVQSWRNGPTRFVKWGEKNADDH